jgi:hypothetical protein
VSPARVVAHTASGVACVLCAPMVPDPWDTAVLAAGVAVLAVVLIRLGSV